MLTEFISLVSSVTCRFIDVGCCGSITTVYDSVRYTIHQKRFNINTTRSSLKNKQIQTKLNDQNH